MTPETQSPDTVEAQAVNVALATCPFCGAAPEVTERAATEAERHAFMCFIACMCGGYSARAHQYGGGETKFEARETASIAWNRRAAPALPQDVAALVEKLEKRAKEDEACAENSRVVADLLAPEMAKFKTRDDAGCNIYAVRMALDHQNSVKRDTKYAEDLRAAIAAIASAREVIERADAILVEAVGALSCCYDVREWPADGDTSQDHAIKKIEAFRAAREWQGR